MKNLLIGMALAASLSAQSNARPTTTTEPQPINLALSGTMPFIDTTLTDCDNLLAFRLSLMEGAQGTPLADCRQATFTESPPLAPFDCVGITANECAALFVSNLPQQYMQGGWNPNNELWYLPLADDVAGGNLCLDGTRQLIYADKAVAWQCSNNASQCATDADCGAGVCRATDIESNNWAFYTQGGGNCKTSQACLNAYMTGETTTTTRGAPFGDDGAGLLSDDPRNPFHGYNRVRLRKCNRDGFTGNATQPDEPNEPRPSGEWDGRKVEFDLHFHGYRQWLAAFDALRDGYANHREFYGGCQLDSDCDLGDQCVTSLGETAVNMCMQSKTLPPLSAAQTVLLSGWSGGATALSHTGDKLVEHLRTGAQPLAPDASVYLAYDAAWKPGLASDTAFWLGHRNMYLVAAQDIPTAAAPGRYPDDADLTQEFGADADFSRTTYVPGGDTFESHVLWGAMLDASCVAAHGDQEWFCHERHHVLANHVFAPSFTRVAQRDAKGKDKPGSSHMHSVLLCDEDSNEFNCYDWIDEEYRQRAFQQILDFYRDFPALAEEGAGALARGAFATDNTGHNGFEDEFEFLDVELMQCREDGLEIGSSRLGQSMAAWIASGHRVGAIERREGVDNGLGYVWVDRDTCDNVCPRVPGTAVFARDNDLGEWDLGTCGY